MMYLKQTEWGCDCVPTPYVCYDKIDINLTPEEVDKINHIFYADPDIEIISEEQKAREDKEEEEREAERRAARMASYADSDGPYERLVNAIETREFSAILPILNRGGKND